MSKAEDQILKAMQVLLNNYTRTAPFDRIVQGRVISRASEGSYNVEIRGETHVVPVYGGINLSPNAIVWVVYPEGNFSNRFILSAGTGGSGGSSSWNDYF